MYKVRGLVLVVVGLAVAGGSAGAGDTAAGPPPGLVREIPVTIVTDGAFRKTHGWQGLARRTVAEATADFEEIAGIRFVPGEELTWEHRGDLDSMEQLLDDAVARIGPRPGLTAVFTGLRPDRQGQWNEMGYAYLGRPALIVAVPRREEIPLGSTVRKELVHYFRHELGHVFGIPHLPSRNVMSDDPYERGPEFTEIALDILRANRNINFRSPTPFSGCDLETLKDAYLFLDSRGECEPALLTNVGVAFLNSGRPAEAAPLFEASLRRNRDSLPARSGFAQATLALGDTLKARSLAAELEAEDPHDGPILSILGSLWVRLGDPERARRILTEALADDSTRFTTWFYRGLASFRLEDYEAARDDFEAAIARDDRPEAWFNLGLACDALDDGDCVRRAFTRYLELDPDGAQADSAREFLERRR